MKSMELYASSDLDPVWKNEMLKTRNGAVNNAIKRMMMIMMMN